MPVVVQYAASVFAALPLALADNGWYRLAQFAAIQLNAASVATDRNVSPDMVTLLFMRTKFA